MQTDRRKSARKRSHFRVFFSGGSIEGEGTVVGLSRSGCRVACETTAPPGTELALWCYAPDYQWPLKVERAGVRWAQAQEFGLEFLNMQPTHKERLRQLMQGDKLM